MRFRFLVATLAAFALSFSVSARLLAADAPAVAAAADLKVALPEIAKAFEADGGAPVTLTFGASGQLASQIANGAPFQLFLSADETLVKGLEDKGLTKDAGALYALGSVALFAREGSTVSVDADLEGLKAALDEGRVTKVAIANPEHAPYGRAARAALQAAGLWTALQPKLVLGENVAQALQFATSGGADAGLISEALLVSSAVPGNHVRVSPALVPPLKQRLVLLKTASPAAEALAAFILSDKGQAILAKYGFSSPERP